MGDSLEERLENIEDRAAETLRELRAMDAGEATAITEHVRGDFHNEKWLSEELDDLGIRYDEIEEILGELREREE